MKTYIKVVLVLTLLIAGFDWIAVTRSAALSFSILHTFSGNLRVNNDGAFPEAGPLLSGNALYGTTPEAGSGYGTVYRINADGTGFTNLHSFTQNEGGRTYAGLVLSGSALYGTTPEGGFGSGMVFKVNTDGTEFTTLHSFAENEGRTFVELVLANNTLYGTIVGGSSGHGTVFALNTDGSGFTILHCFAGPDGESPGRLTLSGNTLYGTAGNGGLGAGTVFKINTDGMGFMVLHRFTALTGSSQEVSTNSDGASPWSPSLVVSGDALYGTASHGGTFGKGTIFRITTDGTEFRTLHNFAGTGDGEYPQGAGLVLSGNTLYGTASGNLFTVNTDGSAFAALHGFTDTISDGGGPLGLTISGNTLYGTANFGGPSGSGTIYRANTNATGFTVLHSFSSLRIVNSDGADPRNGLILSDNTLYGTTTYSGASGGGTVFKVNTDGKEFMTLHSFSAVLDNGQGFYTNSDGAFPSAKLILAGNILYGTAGQGGESGYGTVFKVNADGSSFTTLHCFSVDDGFAPNGLVLSGNTLCGTTSWGGSSGNGAVFAINTNGTGFTVLHRFSLTEGQGPRDLVLSGNTLYGTAVNGGSWGQGTVFSANTDGTGFRTLYSFTGAADGGGPIGDLILSGNVLYGGTHSTIFKINTDGTGFATLLDHISSLQAVSILSGTTLYGTTANGGHPFPPFGQVFAVNTDGTGFTTLLRFPGEINGVFTGIYPYSGVILSGYTFYGTSPAGLSGAVFSLSLAPQLTIIPSGTNVILKWPTNYVGFDYTSNTLQSATDLASPVVVWTNVSPSPVVIGGLNTVINPITGTQRFYRLNR